MNGSMQFSLNETTFILAATILGGVRSISGCLIGIAAMVSLPEIMRFIGVPTFLIGPSRQIMVGVILVIIIIYKPEGISGWLKSIEKK